MTQLSRPYQIALLALGLLVVVWFLALRGHSAETTGGGAGSSVAASAPAPSAAGEAKAAAAPTHVYHGPVPGVEGLTRAIDKAHGAVATSQHNAKQLEEESAKASSSAQASSSTSHGAAASSTASSRSTHARASTGALAKHPSAVGSKAAPRATASKPSTTGASAPKTRGASPDMQRSVEAELKQGKVVTILFWNPKGSVDRAVQRELRAVGHALGGKIAVREAYARQVGSFGSITRAVQVDETPTILIVNRHGQTTTLAGLTDVFSIEQAIGEARKGTAR
jgi:hypothetical protein